jgi:lactate dehydrogenase-like 2-hydroxyacid dehydrogenase
MTEPTKILVLQTSDLPAPAEAALKQRFELLRLPEDDAGRQTLLAGNGHRARALAGSGKGRVDAGLLGALPDLEIISVTSAGLDAIDTGEAAKRGIPIFNTSTILAEDVADLALWLVLGTTRSLVQADRFVRQGRWENDPAFPLGKTIAGMKVGILGLGHIGKAIARRLDVLGAVVGYTGRSKQAGVERPYFSDIRELAAWGELLVVSCPATDETRHMVDAGVLDALGPEGIVVNIARGNIIDEAALVKALEEGRIFGAGLDVFENEPRVPEDLRASPRTILLPHIGSATHGTRARMWQGMVDALLDQFDLPRQDWSAK